MKNKKFVLGFLLVISVGMLAMPLASAQDFGGGDSSNNEDDGGDSTTDDDGDFGGGDSTNNEEESDFSGGDSTNNEESDFDGGDAEEETDEETETRTNRPYTVFGSQEAAPGELNAELSEDSINLGESVTVTGQLNIENNEDREISILLDDTQETSATTNSNGDFQAEFIPEDTGNFTIAAEVDDLRTEMDLEVTAESVRIDSLTSSGENRQGMPIEICANVVSPNEAEVTLYHNDEEFDTTTGQGEMCFEPVLEEGTNTFRVVASADGETDEAQISRNAEPTEPGDETTTTAPTAGFMGSPTARIATVGALIAAIAIAVVLYSRRKRDLTNP